MTPETTTADLMAILAEAGVQNDHGTLRWVFSPRRLEVTSSGGTEQQRIVSLLQQVSYLIENMARRSASSGDALREDLGLTVDMLDVDRLKSWADKIDIHGADISHWAQASFVVTWMQDFAGRLEQCVRDVGTLRAALLASAATDPRPLHERCECATCKAIRAIANPVGLPPSCLAPCPACMSEHGKADPNCQHCGGTGICPSQKVASAATETPEQKTDDV